MKMTLWTLQSGSDDRNENDAVKGMLTNAPPKRPKLIGDDQRIITSIYSSDHSYSVTYSHWTKTARGLLFLDEKTK